MEPNQPLLQDRFLEAISQARIPVSVYLTNGIRIVGAIAGFDAHIVLVKDDNGTQLIYKGAISTVLPSEPVLLQADGSFKADRALRRTQFGLAPTRVRPDHAAFDDTPPLSDDTPTEPANGKSPPVVTRRRRRLISDELA